MREHVAAQLRTQGCASKAQGSPFPSIPTAPERQTKAGAGSGEIKAFFPRLPEGNAPPVESKPSCAAAAKPELLRVLSLSQRHSQKLYISGTAHGNPDKIEELSWRGMVFSHTLPEGLHFPSHPALLA